MTYNEANNLGEMLGEGARAKGMSVAQIALDADIPERYCAALFAGEYHKLPPPPYARGYIWKIAAVLGVDGEGLWQAYLKENPGMRTSGAKDKLPLNRFAVKRVTKTGVVFIILAALVILYGVYFVSKALQGPRLTIASPASEVTETTIQHMVLRGETGFGNKLIINGEETPVRRSGEFSRTISLLPGMNSVVFKVSRFLGGERTVIRQIIYRP